MPYYNTNKIRGKELSDARRRASTDNERVLWFFEQHEGEAFTPWEVHAKIGGCINSLRRAITNMTTDGVLIKTDTRRKSGPHGSTSHCWQLAAPATPKPKKWLHDGIPEPKKQAREQIDLFG